METHSRWDCPRLIQLVPRLDRWSAIHPRHPENPRRDTPVRKRGGYSLALVRRRCTVTARERTAQVHHSIAGKSWRDPQELYCVRHRQHLLEKRSGEGGVVDGVYCKRCQWLQFVGDVTTTGVGLDAHAVV